VIALGGLISALLQISRFHSLELGLLGLLGTQTVMRDKF